MVVCAEDGGYVVTAPALPGMVTDGTSIHEALDNARDAIGVWCEAKARIGALPKDCDPSTVVQGANVVRVCSISASIA